MTCGPYMNENGDWWVPVEGHSFRFARNEVVSCLSYDIPSEGTLLYRGKEMTRLDDEHEAGCEDACPHLRRVLAYRFQENRRW